MLHQTDEYAYVNENRRNVDQLIPVQSSSSKIVDGNQRTVVNNKSQLLAKCSVLYLGTTISSTTQLGIDAIQEPLSKRYPLEQEVVRGIEAWLSIYDNGLQLQFIHDPSVIIFYPIHSLVYCASIRYATRSETGAKFANGWRFVSLDSPAASRFENTRNPPLFAITFHRTRHLPADECHCFVAKTKQAALALVQACYGAYQTTESEQDCSKVPLYFKINDDGSKNKEIDDEIYITPASNQEQITDYQTSTEGAGFFYATDRVPIDSWQLGEQHKHESESHYGSSTNLNSSNPRNRTSVSSTPQPHINSLPTSIPEQPSEPTVDPYAPAPNLLRVERIKDANSGRDIFIRWLQDTNTVSQPVYSKPNYDYHVDYYIDDQPEKKLSNELERLTVTDEHPKKPSHHERLIVKGEHSKKKSHHNRKNHKKEKYRNDATFNGHYRKKRSNKTYTIDNYQHTYGNIVDSSLPETTYNSSAPQTSYDSSAPQTIYNSSAPETTYYPSAPQTAYNLSAPETTYYRSASQTTYNSTVPETTYYPPLSQTTYNSSAPETTYNFPLPPFNTFILDNSSSHTLSDNMNISSPIWYHFP